MTCFFESGGCYPFFFLKNMTLTWAKEEPNIVNLLLRQAERLTLSCQWDRPHANTAHIQVTLHEPRCFQNNLWSVYTNLPYVLYGLIFVLTCTGYRGPPPSFACTLKLSLCNTILAHGFKIIRQKQSDSIQHLCLSKLDSCVPARGWWAGNQCSIVIQAGGAMQLVVGPISVESQWILYINTGSSGQWKSLIGSYIYIHQWHIGAFSKHRSNAVYTQLMKTSLFYFNWQIDCC